MKIWSLSMSAMLVGCIASSLSWAAYPERHITLIVNFGPGGGTDLVARAAAAGVQKILGQPIVIVNQAGAGGTVGVAAIASAKPDGYTIGVVTMTNLSMAPYILPVRYKSLEDFEFIGGIAKYIYGTSVPSNSPFKTLKDLIDYARAHPGKINYGVQGLSTANNVAMVRLSKAEGVNMTPIPFKSTTDEVVSALGGTIDVTNQDPPVTVPQIRAGKLRLLASFSDQRWKWVPDVPTVKELGYDFSVSSYLGVAAPKGTPEPIMTLLRNTFKAVVQTPEFIDAVDRIFLVAEYRDHVQWRKDVEAGLAENEVLTRELGLQYKSQQQ